MTFPVIGKVVHQEYGEIPVPDNIQSHRVPEIQLVMVISDGTRILGACTGHRGKLIGIDHKYNKSGSFPEALAP